MNARERQRASDRARWDGLVLQELNALVYISRYRGAHETYKTVQKHLQTLLTGGYVVSDGDGGYTPTERGWAIVRRVYQESHDHIWGSEPCS